MFLRTQFTIVFLALFAGWGLTASAQEPQAVDQAIDKLVALDAGAVAQKIQELKSQLAAKEAESKELKAKADALESQATALDKRVSAIHAVIDKLAKGLGIVPAAVEPQAKATGEMVGGDMGGKMMDGNMMGGEAKKAKSEKPKITYQQHVVPILESTCFRCHNDDRTRGGLNMTTFAKLMDGGSSGPVVEPGRPDGSRLYQLATQNAEPKMPPSGSPLEDGDLKVLMDWIAAGALENADSEAMKVAKLETKKGPVFVAAEQVDGPPPMPEVDLPLPTPSERRGVVARAVASSPTAPLVAVGGDGEVILYDLENFKVLGALLFPEGDIYTLTFSLNGELLLAGGGEEGDHGAAALFSVRKANRLGVFGKAYDTVLAADISPDHELIAVGGPSRAVRVYSAKTGEELYKLDKHTDWIYAVKFTPDGEVLSTADRAGNLHMWQAANGRPVEALSGHNGPIHDLDYTYDSVYLVSAGEDGQVMIWDTWKFNQVRRFKAHDSGVLSVNVSKDGHIVTSGKDGLTKRWDLNGKNLSTYEKQPDWSYQARFGAQGNFVLAGSWTGEIAVWKTDSGERVAKLETSPQP